MNGSSLNTTRKEQVQGLLHRSIFWRSGCVSHLLDLFLLLRQITDSLDRTVLIQIEAALSC